MVSDKARIRRLKSLARYDEATVHRFLDADCLCHVAFCVDGQPFVIPMLYARKGSSLYLHGSVASRLQKELAAGLRACVSVTITDGIVLARSGFNHSFNYRSVVAFGSARPVLDDAGKNAALDAIMESVLRGRSADARPADRKEMAATSILCFDIAEASAKHSAGPPDDKPEDIRLPVWAGVIPIRRIALPPVAAPDLLPDIALPDYLDPVVSAVLNPGPA